MSNHLFPIRRYRAHREILVVQFSARSAACVVRWPLYFTPCFPLGCGIHMFSRTQRSFVISFAAFLTVTLTGCDSGPTGVHKEAGPLPLSSPDAPMVRLVDKSRSFGRGEVVKLFWDEGKGPIIVWDRIKPILDSIPKELRDRMHSRRDVPAKLYAPFTDTGTTYQYIFDTWEVVVSLNPDVVIVSTRETPVGPHPRLPASWDSTSIDRARSQYLDGLVECINGGVELNICAGTLVPWSEEMHVFSTDPKVKTGRLVFENNRAEIPLPVGKLLLVRNGDDVKVTRE